MRRQYVVPVIALALLVLTGCDPDQRTLDEGRNIDLNKIEGKISSKVKKRFSELARDANGQSVQGQEYNCLTIARTDTRQTEEFCGVSDEVFLSVDVGMELPNRLLTLKRMTEIQGRVVDKISRPDISKFYVVVDQGYGVEIYEVTSEVYYRNIEIGMQLPADFNTTAR